MAGARRHTIILEAMPKITQARFAALSGAAMGVPMNEQADQNPDCAVLRRLHSGRLRKMSAKTNEGTELWRWRSSLSTPSTATAATPLVHLPEIGIKGNSHFLMGEKTIGS